VHLLKVYGGEAVHSASPWINVGCGADLTIAELAEQVRAVVGFEGRLRYDTERPDGTPQKLLDVSRLTALGWQPRIPLDQGLAATYRWYLDRVAPGAAPGRPPAPASPTELRQ
jgi:GDP-L-fucose synthase